MDEDESSNSSRYQKSPMISINFSTFETTLETFRDVHRSGFVSLQFMEALRIAMDYRPVYVTISNSLGSLDQFYYDVGSRRFTKPWDLETLQVAIEKMQQKKTSLDNVEQVGATTSSDVTINPDDVNCSLFENVEINDCEPPLHSNENGQNDESARIEPIEVVIIESVDQEIPPASTMAEQSHVILPSSPLLIEGPVLEEWRSLIGDSVHLLTHQDFVNLSKIRIDSYENDPTAIPPFAFEKKIGGRPLSVNDLRGWIHRVLPYVLQKVKMWGCGVLEPENLKRLVPDIDKQDLTTTKMTQRGPKINRKNFINGDIHSSINGSEPSTSSSRNGTSSSVPLSRLDLLTCLINCVDVIVKQDILRNISAFPVAIPLIIPSLFEKRMINLLPLLRFISLRKKKINGDIAQNYLFGPTFKLILCVRLGNTSTVGKSCILNSVLKRKWIFSSKQEPGANLGKPVSLPGLVEFVPLTEETCSTQMWKNLESVMEEEDVILLANMHGDPLKHPEVFKTVLAMANGAVVFTLPETTTESLNVWNEIAEVFGQDTPCLDVDDGENDQFSIQTADLYNDETMKKVRTAITEAVKLKRMKMRDEEILPKFDNISMVEGMSSKESNNLSDLIYDKSVSKVKDVLSTKTRQNYDSVTDLATEKALEEQVLSLFCSLLNLPVKERMLGMIHLEKQLADLTNKQSSKVLNELLKLEAALKAITGDEEEKQTKKQNLKKLIGSHRDLLSMNNFGLEHFYRKIGKMYEAALVRRDDEKFASYLETPSLYAQLLLNGHAVELLDGESDRPVIHATWFAAICQKISEAKPNLRIFVISVVGLQSSGKSTLLNALFGCKFAVSMGRCTKGLFLRLIFLNDELKEMLNKDAVFVIDMEGLCSPEMVNDPKAEEKDRIMTTFVMGISNLTLINISGESSNSMTDILQIAIVAMARLHDVKLSPDLFVVQHLSENNTQKVATAHNEFIKAIEKAIGMTEKKGIFIGIHDSRCMKNLMERAGKGNVLKAFGPFRNGEFISSPPSSGYHESIVSLYNSILEACRDCDSKHTFDSWYKLLNGYLDAVLSENLVVRFKNLIEMSEHLERGSRINDVKEDIEKTFRQHSLELEPEIRRRIQAFQQNNTDRGENAIQNSQLEQKLMDIITQRLRLIPNGCREEENESRACTYCEQAVSKMESLFSHVRDTPAQEDTVVTITKFINETGEACVNRLKNMIGAELLQQGLSKEFCEIINESLNQFVPGKTERTEREYKVITDSVWMELQRKVDEKYPCTMTIQERIVHDIVVTYTAFPDAASRYRSPEMPNLATKEAYRETNCLLPRYEKLKPLETKDLNELMMLLDRTTEVFALQNPNIQHIYHGIMQSVKRMIDDNIAYFKKISGIRLLGDYKWEIHVYCLKKFGLFFDKLERKWENANDPSKVLEKNKNFYVNLIQTRLRYGFSAVGEGHVIANLLGIAVSQKAVTYANDSRVGKVLDLSWIVNAENVRLRYFSHLAKEVEKGNTYEALSYFTRPKIDVTEWFVEQVDSMFLEECRAECSLTFQNEMSNVMQTIKNKRTMDEINHFLEEYFTQVGSPVTYQSTLEGEGGNIQATNLDLLKNAVEQGLRDNQEHLETLLTPSQPSESTRVMNRIGCTEHCFWCGALCWGQRGHEKNADSTKIHHACHQPSGLIGIIDKNDKTLLASPCQDTSDECMVFWGQYNDSGMLWRNAKQHDDFKDWLFKSHTKVEFNQLMYWFFKKINRKLAVYMGVEPCPEEALSRGTYSNLDSVRLDEILAAIELELKTKSENRDN